MELLDSSKNDENTGCFSRRRISSILKDPRKSTRFSDPEQQENEVECAKPVGKRNSRRVSFAPSNDVLLYSKDAKHASPFRGPFQELMSTAIPAQNGVQVSVGEEGIVQQIMGMEPLISGTLHACHLKGNANFELGEGFGAKTVVYDEDDGFMEMTQSHTINIAETDDYRGDDTQKNRPTLLSCGKKSTMSSANGESMDMSLSHNANIARELEMPRAGRITDFSVMSSVLSLDPSFNKLLHSKSRGSSVRQRETTFETKMSLIKTQMVDVDKENQAPILVHSETGKSPHNGKNIGLSHNDDGKMDVSVTHTDHVTGLNDDPDDPFQCLFPQQEMYSQCDTASQARRTRITLESSNPKAAFGNRLEKENAEEATLQIANKNALKNHSFHALQEQRDNSKEKSTEKVTGFTADDACLDMAQSCTAKITGALSPPPAPNFNHFLCEGKTALLAPSMEKKHRATTGHPLSSGISLDPKFENFLANIFKTDRPRVNPGHDRMTQVNPLVRANEQPFNGDPVRPKENLSMNMTEFQRDDVTRVDEPLRRLRPTQLIHPKGQQATFHQLFSDEQRSIYNTGKEIGTSDNSNLDVTQSGCVNTPRTFTMRSRKIRDSLPSSDERTVRFTANDAAMDMTQSLTVNIDLPLETGAHKSVPLINAGGENTIRFSANDAAMEMTQSLTAMIDTPFEAGAHKSVPFMHAGRENTIRFSANDAAMDMTQNLTTIIDTQPETGAHKEVHSVPNGGEKTIRFSANDEAMEMTQSLTAMIDTPFEAGAPQSVPFVHPGGENTNRFSANDAAMDMTQNLTTIIDTRSETGGHKEVNSVPQGGEKTIRFSTNDAAMDMTQSLTAMIDTPFEAGAHTNVPFTHVRGENTIRFSANDAAMDMTQNLTTIIDTQPETGAHKEVHSVPNGGEKTIRFSANDEAMEMTQSLTAMIDTPFEAGAPQSVPFVHPGGENTNRFSANDAAMDMTQNLTTIIDTRSETGGHKEVNSVPQGGEKTIRFSTNDAAMDMTQSLTAMIDTPFEAGAHTNVPFTHVRGENTIRFSANDAAMDMTQNLTTIIDTRSETGAHKEVHSVPNGGEKTSRFSTDDAAMDMTQSLTAMIDTPFEGGPPKSVPFTHVGGENTIRFSANDAAMDMTQNLTTIIDTRSETGAHKEVHSVPNGGEKTSRFSTDDAAMDMTQSLTAMIDTPFEAGAPKSVPFTHVGGENTIRFSANDAAMEMTQSVTAMIDTPFVGGPPKSVPFTHVGGENTIRFSANDAAMDMTQNLTTIIDTRSKTGAHKEVHSVPQGGENTIRFSANDAAMEMTQSLTAMIDTPFEAGAPKSVPFTHVGGENTIRFSANDAAMEMTQNLTTIIDSRSETGAHKEVYSVPQGGENTIRFSANDAAMEMTQSVTAMIDTPLDPEAHKNHSVATGGEKTIRFSASDAAMDVTQRKRLLSGLRFNPGQNIFCNTDFPWPHRVVTKADPPAEPSFAEAVDTNCFVPAQLKTLYVDDKYKVPGVTTLHDSLLSTQKNADGNLHGVDVSINPTDVQTDSSTQRPYADVRGTQEMTSQQSSQELGRDVEESPDAVNSEETQSRKEAESRIKTSSLSQKLNSPGAGDDGRDSSHSTRFRIADLQLKVRRLSQLVSATSETNLEPDTDKNTRVELNESEFVPDVQPGLRDTEDEDTRYGLLCGNFGFKPKLPQRIRADEPKKADSASGISQEKSARRTATDVTNTLNKWNDDDVSDIYDEELGSCEDLSDTLDSKISENAIPFEDFNVDGSSLDNVSRENSPNGAQGIKRRLPSDENKTGDEKKMKSSGVMLPEAVATEIPAHVLEYDRVNTTTVPSSNQTMDFSNSTLSNSSRSDPTFNSTFKHSMLESHLEDRDMQKLKDGSITALEFFKLFNIDFVFHKPRQSVLPGRVPRGTGCSAMDVLKNRHINYPKRIVYEADFEIVSQKMEGLNCRMLDLNKPLKVINQDLWADVKKSSEMEIRSLGVKLKERNNFFRKMSKVRAHEMKAVLYSSLVQTLADEQQKFKSAVESNEMIQILDDCIGDLEAELAAVEEKGTENMSSLKSLQEEMKKVNEALDDRNRQIHELEVQKKQASGKLSSLKAETRNLESFIGTLHTLTEWRIREKTENYTVYTFLYDTLHLQLVHAGNSAEKEPERKTAHMNFQFLLHDEKSENHACFVHKLLSQHIKGETAWVERYPTSSCIAKLLHDVSSVVSTCRLLGEELRMLKMWGGLRLNIVDIRCEDTRVNLVFSSLRKRCKFEVTLSVTLANHLYVLQVHGFNNVIGDTTAKQIERIVESFTPAKKLLTKIVKKINCDLLG